MIVTEIYNSQRNYVEIVHKIEPSNNDTIHNIIRNIGPVQIQKNEFKVNATFYPEVFRAFYQHNIIANSFKGDSVGE